jgi:hypothetical protein
MSARLFLIGLMVSMSFQQQVQMCLSVSQKPMQSVACQRPFTSGSADMEEYRTGYVGRQDNLAQSDNLLFYTDKLPSRPDQLNVTTMLRTWRGDFDTLESRHGYIQWLFPVQSRSGANSQSQELFAHEIAAMVADAAVRDRVRDAYAMMLEFYGLRLADNDTGRVERSSDWAARFAHLDSASHNFLRISRILKSIGDLSFERYKFPFLKLLATEIYENGQIQSARASLREYWSEALRNVTELRLMRATVARYDSNYASSVNPQVCTELSVCSTSSAKFCDCLNSRCGQTTQYCCETGTTPVLVSNICQCIIGEQQSTTVIVEESSTTTATSDRVDHETETESSTTVVVVVDSGFTTTVIANTTTDVIGASDNDSSFPVGGAVAIGIVVGLVVCGILAAIVYFNSQKWRQQRGHRVHRL